MYFEEQEIINKSIEQEFIKRLVEDEEYDHFDFGHLLPLKMSEKWVKSKLKYGDNELTILHTKKQDEFYFLKTYFYFVLGGKRYRIGALIHKKEVTEFESE